MVLIRSAPAGHAPAGPVFGECTWTSPSAGTAVVAMRGEIDAIAIPSLSGCLDDVVSAGQRRVVLDMAEVTFIDSVGLAAIVAATKRLAAHGGTLSVRRPSAHVHKLLEITGLTGFVPVEV
ncbi:MAG TPA: STAS domain-containing protein [Acidimicrobiales bacterium]|nr:STAS domain-containing protein [Acidimicrobiales bacterium]